MSCLFFMEMYVDLMKDVFPLPHDHFRPSSRDTDDDDDDQAVKVADLCEEGKDK